MKIIFVATKNNNAPNITKRIKVKWIINVKSAANSYIYFLLFLIIKKITKIKSIVAPQQTQNHDP